jgi:transcriptional regulator of acetoin/glycerol metabolism
MSGATLRMQSLESLFGTSVSTLVDRFRSPLATPLPVRTSQGRPYHLHARFDWPVWTSLAEAVAAQVPGAAVVSSVLRAAAAADGAAPASTTQCDTTFITAVPRDAHAAALVERLQRALEHCISSVLIGETGAGKEWLARCAHRAAAGGPFVALSCTGLQPGSIESAVFDGALGENGTLYLDEIGALPPPSQQRLLRFLDAPGDGSSNRHGKVPPLRLVCASREPLRTLLESGSLREDLCYRLNGLTLRAPALRERSDLIDLAQAIVEQEAPGKGMRLSTEVVAVLQRHHWPGNLRQLHNVLRTAVALASHEREILREHLSEDVVDDALNPPALAGAERLHQSLDELTLEAISQAVDAAGGNISEASRQLGVSRNTIYRKLRWNAAD